MPPRPVSAGTRPPPTFATQKCLGYNCSRQTRAGRPCLYCFRRQSPSTFSAGQARTVCRQGYGRHNATSQASRQGQCQEQRRRSSRGNLGLPSWWSFRRRPVGLLPPHGALPHHRRTHLGPESTGQGSHSRLQPGTRGRSTGKPPGRRKGRQLLPLSILPGPGTEVRRRVDGRAGHAIVHGQGRRPLQQRTTVPASRAPTCPAISSRFPTWSPPV